MSYKLKPQPSSFHYSAISSNTNFCPNLKEIKSKSIICSQNVADLNADELFENFDDLFEIKVKETSNPDSFRMDTHRTIIKDLSKKFNDAHYLQNINLGRTIIYEKPQNLAKKEDIFYQEKKYTRDRYFNESFHSKPLNQTQKFNEYKYNDVSKASINAKSFSKKVDEISFEGSRNRSFHTKTNANIITKPKLFEKNKPYLMTLENKENLASNINRNNNKEENQNKKQYNGYFNHRRVETYCDNINSIDEGIINKPQVLQRILPLNSQKDESNKLINKSLISLNSFYNDKRKSKEMNSFENVGRLLKLLKQDAEKKINFNKKLDLSFTTMNFLKPKKQIKPSEKEKTFKRSISSGYTRKLPLASNIY